MNYFWNKFIETPLEPFSMFRKFKVATSPSFYMGLEHFKMQQNLSLVYNGRSVQPKNPRKFTSSTFCQLNP